MNTPTIRKQPDWSQLKLDTDLTTEEENQLLPAWTAVWPSLTAQIAADLRAAHGEDVRYFPSGRPLYPTQIHGDNFLPLRLSKESRWEPDIQKRVSVLPYVLILGDESLFEEHTVYACFDADGTYLSAELITG